MYNKKIMPLKESVARSSLNEGKPLLLKTPIDIAIFGKAVDSRRRKDTVQNTKTLSRFVKGLKKIGCTISCSGTNL